MIRQFRERWKCGKGSSLFAKFAHAGVRTIRPPLSPALRRKGVLRGAKTVAILSQTAGKCGGADRACSREITRLAIDMIRHRGFDCRKKLFIPIAYNGSSKITGAVFALKSARGEQTHVNMCRILRLPTAAFRPNDDRG
jgi:hypothetical protein